MRNPFMVLPALVLCAGLLHAQQSTKLEVGTHLGGSLAFGGGSTEFSGGVPAPANFFAGPAVYLSLFATPHIMIEPQIAFSWNSIIEEPVFSGVLQFGYLMSPDAPSSAYFAVHGGWTTIYGEAKSGLFGGGLGMRFLIQEHLSIRTEARYRRWTCSGCELNEVGLLIGLGAALP